MSSETSPLPCSEPQVGRNALRQGEWVAANPELQEWTADYLGYEETTKVSPISITELEIVVTRP